MLIARKTQYALRAIFQLSKQHNQGPAKIADIAKVQAIPPRFLEVILNQLKQGKFVDSKRGNEGGYFLVRSPDTLTVGEIIRYVHGPLNPVDCIVVGSKDCELHGRCAFQPMWEKVSQAISDVFDHTTFKNLIETEIARSRDSVAMFSI
jgi:Rrf2 family transcriptional regulator, cysteine metabolism repressor